MSNIQKLFGAVRDKTAFVNFLAKEMNKNPVGIRANWFSTGKIPEKYEATIHKYLIKWLQKEMKKVQLLIQND